MSTACTLARGIPAADQEAFILRHLSLVRSIAQRIRIRLPQHVELSDLIGAGTLGLIDAVRRFDPDRDAAFPTYAHIRIRGAILDSLRSDDWGSRRLRQLARRIDAARDHLSFTLGRLPTLSELAAHLGLDERDLEHTLTEVRGLQVASFAESDDDEVHGTSLDQLPARGPDPLYELLQDERNHWLQDAVAELPARDRHLMQMYYGEELTMKEIGERLGVTESRVSQLHALAVKGLKKRLRSHAI